MNKKIFFFAGLFLNLEVLSSENFFHNFFKKESTEHFKAVINLNDQDLLKKFAELVVFVNMSQDESEKQLAQYTLKTELYGFFVMMCDIVEKAQISEEQALKMSTDSSALYEFLKQELEKE